MPFRNSPLRPRRYSFANKFSTSNEPSDPSTTYVDLLKSDEQIPLPNKIEDIPVPTTEKRSSHWPSFLNFFSNGIGMEELLLIGLLFLILDEGIADDFFILILLYILLF